MKKIELAVAVIGTSAFTAAVYYAAAATIRRLSVAAALFYDNEIILRALERLVLADVNPPLWIPLICGFIVSALVFCVFKYKKRGITAIAVKTVAVFGVIMITVSAYAGTLYFTSVNGVPVHCAMKIIMNIIESGILG